MIVYDTKNYKEKNRSISIHDITNESQDSDISNSTLRNLEENTSNFDEDFYQDSHILTTKYSKNNRLSNFMDEYVDYCTLHIYELFPKKKDAQIADAILELFRKRENIDIFNKKALYIFIKEQIDADTTSITKIIKQMRDIYKDLYSQYQKDGIVKKL